MNAPRILASALLATLLLFAAAPAGAGPPEASELIRRSEERSKSSTEHIRYRMELVDAGGKVEQERTLEIFYKRTAESEVTLQKFLSPPIFEDSGMRIVDSGQPANDIWMYLPATRRLRRISGAEKSNWYMGTQFTYEDFEDYQREVYEFRLLRQDACGDGERCWVIEALPATPEERKASGYGKKVYWLEQESLYPVRVDYLGKDGRELKRATIAGLEKDGAYHRPARIVMEDLTNGRSTRLIVLEREIDAPLEDYYVSNRYLRED